MRDTMIFYRSFYDAIKNLSQADQCEIYNAIFSYGLNFEEPELTGVPASFWTLIKPQIDANIKRFENGKKPKSKQTESEPEAKQKQTRSKSGTNNNNNNNNNNNDFNIVPFENGTTIEKIDFDGLLTYINNTFGRKFKTITEPIRKKYNARMKEGYKKADITNAINNCHKDQFHRDHNYKYCTPEFFSRSEILEKYSEVTKQEKIITAFHPIVFD